MEYMLVIEAISSEQAQERVESIFEGRFDASIQRITYLFMNRYAVRIRIDELENQLQFAWEGALNSIMGNSHLVWWNRVTP
jgi:hypothetical protein